MAYDRLLGRTLKGLLGGGALRETSRLQARVDAELEDDEKLLV